VGQVEADVAAGLPEGVQAWTTLKLFQGDLLTDQVKKSWEITIMCLHSHFYQRSTQAYDGQLNVERQIPK